LVGRGVKYIPGAVSDCYIAKSYKKCQ